MKIGSFYIIIEGMEEKFRQFLQGKQRICVIQAENPDGDSLGSALALYELLTEKEVSLYCPVDIPKYLRYFKRWDLVTKEFDYEADGYIIVDTAANVLLSKVLEDPVAKNTLYVKPVLVIDHHETEDDLEFAHEAIVENVPASAQVIFELVRGAEMEISREAALNILAAIMSDTLGLSSANVSVRTLEIVTELMKMGVSIFEIDEARREFMKKSQRILEYKADLIRKIEYFLDGKLAIVHIPWEEIREYSDEYNPGVLIIEEMRMVEGVEVAVAVKTYPDGKVTGKIRSSTPVAETLAGYFGGGGHKFAAGFRTYDVSYEEVVRDLVGVMGNTALVVDNAGSEENGSERIQSEKMGGERARNEES